MPLRSFVIASAAAAMTTAAAQADMPDVDELLSGVVHVSTAIDPEGRTVANLGRFREGSGVVVDDDGLVLTIGHVMVEAFAAEVRTNEGRSVPATVLGYDHDTGFGLLRATEPLKVRPMQLGRSADIEPRDQLVIAGYGGPARVAATTVVSRRAFTGNWEYLLDSAIYTAPPYPDWSGAALIDSAGKLVGIGSMFESDSLGDGTGLRGNMFVPIDELSGVFAEMLAGSDRLGAQKPWLGVNTAEVGGRLHVNRVSPGGPAERAGLRQGDTIAGVDGEEPEGLADFYRKIWALGEAGVVIPLDVIRGDESRRFDVESMNRLHHLKLRSSF